MTNPIARLYKEEQEIDVTELFGTTIKYYPVSLSQVPLLISFFVEGVVALNVSEYDLKRMSLTESLEKLKDVLAEIDGEKNKDEILLSRGMASLALRKYMYPCIQECFPDIDINLLSTEGLYFLTVQIIQDFNKLIAEFQILA